MNERRFSSREYTDMADAVRDFRDKLAELVQHTGFFGPPGIGFEVPLDGHDNTVEALRAEVSQLAGVAQEGFAVTNTLYETVMEDGKRTVLNPAAAWLTILTPKAMLRREDVLEAANLAEGRLRALAKRRATEERSIAGRIAAVIRFPSHVRELTGYPANSAAGKATAWSVGTILAGVVASLLASGIWALIAFVF